MILSFWLRLCPTASLPLCVFALTAVVGLNRPHLRYRIGCLLLPKHFACWWPVGHFGQGSRQIVGIAGKRQQAEGRMKKKERGMEKSEGRGQSSTGPRGSEVAQNMGRVAVREAGRPCAPRGGPANQPRT